MFSPQMGNEKRPGDLNRHCNDGEKDDSANREVLHCHLVNAMLKHKGESAMVEE